MLLKLAWRSDTQRERATSEEKALGKEPGSPKWRGLHSISSAFRYSFGFSPSRKLHLRSMLMLMLFHLNLQNTSSVVGDHYRKLFGA